MTRVLCVRHILGLAFGILILLQITVSASILGSGPRDIVEKYLDAVFHGNYINAYEFISQKDKQIKSLEEYLSENSPPKAPLAEIIFKKLSYKIEEVKISDNEAVVTVQLAGPDLSDIYPELMRVAILSTFGNREPGKLKQTLFENLDKYTLPNRSFVEVFSLTKEDDGWKIFFDWRSDKESKERKKKIKYLLLDAEACRREKEFYSAIQKYRKILDLDDNIVEAKVGLADVQREIERFKEKQEYIKSVALINVKVGKGKKYRFEDPVDAVFGTIVNRGERTLKEVEVTVYFLDKNGKAIWEEDYYPILVTRHYSSDNKLLKPNYVKDFGYKVKDEAPSLWARRIRAKITNIEFADVESRPMSQEANPFQDQRFNDNINDNIKECQQLLSELGYDPGPPDNVLGTRTKQAIEAFQKESGIKVNGEFSQELLSALRMQKISKEKTGKLLTPKALTSIDLYKLSIANQIEKNWSFSSQSTEGKTDLKTILVIKIMSDGAITEIGYEKKSGNSHFDESVSAAVKNSSPLPPLPDEFPGDHYIIGLVFTPEGLKKGVKMVRFKKEFIF